MFDPFRVFSPVVVFKDGGGGDGGGAGGGDAGGGEGGGEGGAGDGQGNNTGGGDGDKGHQQHFDRGFSLGFGKGAEKAEKEAKDRTNKILQALGIDPKGDVDAQLAETGDLLKKAREGGKGGTDDSQTEEMLKQVRQELKTAHKTIEELKSSHGNELEKILIDQTLLNLAGGAPLAKSVLPRKVVLLFKDDFKLSLDKDRNVTVTQPNGAPIIDSATGEPKALDGVFKDWIGGQSHLLDKTNTGGSGGQGREDGGGGAGSGGAGGGGKGRYTPEQIKDMPMADYEKARAEGKIK